MVVGADGKQIMPGSNPNLPQNQGILNKASNWLQNKGQYQKPGGFQGAPAAAPAPAATPAPAPAATPVTNASGQVWKDASGNPIMSGGAGPGPRGRNSGNVDENVTFQNDELNRIVSLVRHR
jgi:hypothetical protein